MIGFAIAMAAEAAAISLFLAAMLLWVLIFGGAI